MPYTYYFHLGKKCLISIDFTYYSKYIYSKKSYNNTYIVLSHKSSLSYFLLLDSLFLIVSIVTTLIKQERKLEIDKGKASNNLLKLYKEIAIL
jgi:hypothetical protein